MGIEFEMRKAKENNKSRFNMEEKGAKDSMYASKEYLATKDESDIKKYQLLKDFQEAGYDKGKEIEIEELLNYITNRSRGISRNESYTIPQEEKKAIEKLFATIDKNNHGTVTIQELVDGVIEHQTFCVTKQDGLQKDIKLIEREIEELKNQKEADKKNRGSFQKSFTITINEAKNLSDKGISGAAGLYVITNFESQSQRTKTVSSSSNPIWSEVFYFTVKDSKEKINLAVWIQDGLSRKDKLEGICVFDLLDESANDQTKKTIWKILQDENGNDTAASVKIGLQYVHDKVKQTEDRIHKKEEEYFKVKEEYRQLSEFSKKATNQFDMIISKNFHDGAEPDNEVVDYRARPVEKNIIEPISDHKLLYVEEIVAEKMKNIFVSKDGWVTKINYAVIGYAVLAIFITFAREDFINLILSAMLFFAFIISKRITSSQIRWLMYFLLGSFVYDIVALFLLGSDFLSDVPITSGIEVGLRRFALVGMLLIALGKIPMTIIVFRAFVEMNSPTGSSASSLIPSSENPQLFFVS
eukprot:TRINITY_DN2076_c0_g1_i3.p1 TRINITY_DN2076_c0_g1~~TRINITY_DN2076_c0_g1_i3.p1  ORF type:complete len:558 (-),score=123.38 TRINITY_DN2076_c0_g1_i3:84-1664(-)